MPQSISRTPPSRARRMSGRMVGAGLAALLALVGCNTVTTTEQPVEMMVQLEGTVTDGATGLPIEGATIEILVTFTNEEFGAATTDAAGNYEISFLYRFFLSDPSSSFCPFLGFVEASGYSIQTISPLCTGNVEIHDVEMLVG